MSEAGSWFVEGIGEDFIPPIADFALVKKAYSISDAESFLIARELLHREGILAGSSSGTLIAATLKYCSEQQKPKNVVTFVCDTGNKYLTKMFNDAWLHDNGFSDRTLKGNLADIVTRRFSDKEVIYLKLDDLIKSAYQKMKLHEISQFPVIDGTSVVGIIDESDLLEALLSNTDFYQSTVRSVMSVNLATLSPEDKITDVIKILSSGMVPVITGNSHFIGLITKIDLISFLIKNKINPQ